MASGIRRRVARLAHAGWLGLWFTAQLAVAAPQRESVAAFEKAHVDLLRQGKYVSATTLANDAVRRGTSTGDRPLAVAAHLAIAETGVSQTERREHAAAAVDLLKSAGDESRLSEARARHALASGGPYDAAMTQALLVVTQARAQGDATELARALALAEEVARLSGNRVLAERYGRESTQVPGLPPAQHRRLQTLLFYNFALMKLGRTDEARQALQEAQRLAIEAGDLGAQGEALFRQAMSTDDPAGQLAGLQKYVDFAAGHEGQQLAVALTNMADLQIRAGMLQQALANADRALALLAAWPRDEGALFSMRSMATFNKGWALNRLGRHDEGLKLIDEALVEDPLGGAEAAEEFAYAGRHKAAYERLQAYSKAVAAQASATVGVEKAANDYAAEHLARVEAEGRLARAEQQHTVTLAASAGLVAGSAVLGLLLRQRLLRRHAGRLAHMNEKLETLAKTDALTGLHNRHHFMGQIAHHVAAADRSHSTASAGAPHTQLTFFVIDLDHFKRVNDEWGHAAGDAVLKEAAVRLAALVRAEDELVRWGGEEFLLMTRGPATVAAALAERIRAAVAGQPFALPSGELRVCCSIGFATYPVAAHAVGQPDWHGVVDLADQALYRVKHHGRNGWSGVASVSQPIASVDASTLADALEHGALLLTESFNAAQPA